MIDLIQTKGFAAQTTESNLATRNLERRDAGMHVQLENVKKTLLKEGFFVRVIGLEPTCLTASDPKSDTSANFATPAF